MPQQAPSVAKAKGGRRRSIQQVPHPLAELAKRTSFAIPELEVVAAHHQMLNQFCVAPADEREDGYNNGSDSSRTSVSLGLEQYCTALSTLIKCGEPSQQFQYLFHTYATETGRGITCTELFELLQDHYADSPSGIVQQKAEMDAQSLRERHFERLYTWLKKHMNAYDRQRVGALPLRVAWEMLEANPTATRCLQFRVAPFVARVKCNNERYQEKAAAADVSL